MCHLRARACHDGNRLLCLACCLPCTCLQVIDNYPSEWDFLKRHIVTLKTLATQEVRCCMLKDSILLNIRKHYAGTQLSQPSRSHEACCQC
jgi:hypothetical protein